MQKSEQVEKVLCVRVPRDLLDEFHKVVEKKCGKWYSHSTAEVQAALRFYIEKNGKA